MNDFLRGLLHLPPEASSYAAGIDLLHFFVIAFTMLGALFVFLLALYYLLRYGQRRPGELTPRIETSTPLEILIIGGLQALFLAFWVIGAVQYEHLTNAPPNALSVYVTAKQWMWKFSYPDGRSSMDTLFVPLGRPVRLVMTSRDVIHSFYVPAFRIKHDVLPGRYETTWFTATMAGSFRIDCAEYCGLDHSRMLGDVRVLSPEEYAAWLARGPQGAATAGSAAPPPRGLSGAGETSDLVARGREVATRRACLNCHTLNGQRFVGPTWAGLFESRVPLSDGRTVVADESYLTRSMMEPEADLVAGFKPIMPTYRGVLKEPEVAALVELIKSLSQPAESPGVELPIVVPETSAQPQKESP